MQVLIILTATFILIEKLKEVLNPDQFTVFLNLRKDKLKAEEKFKKKNPDYVFTKEDEELDF
jgi:hypothetical protein